MSIRIPSAPIEVFGPSAVGNAAGLAGLGMDGFSLYAALRDASVAQGGTGGMLVSWPFDPRLIPNGVNMTDQRVMLRPQLVKGGLQIDGVAWVQVNNGNYTANNNNKIGAYTYDGTQMTQVAQCANDGTLWQSGGGYRIKPFTVAYTPPSDMILWAAGLHCRSAAVTVPSITTAVVSDTGAKNLGLIAGGTPGDTMAVDVTGATNLTATFLDAVLDNTNVNLSWLAFYHLY